MQREEMKGIYRERKNEEKETECVVVFEKIQISQEEREKVE